MRPSDRLTRFMDNTDYQVSNKRTKKNSLNGVILRSRSGRPTCLEKGLQIAPAPLQFLPDDTKE
jgi:hypothetical protein